MTSIRFPGHVQGNYVRTSSGALVRKDAIEGTPARLAVNMPDGEQVEVLGTVSIEDDDTIVLRDCVKAP